MNKTMQLGKPFRKLQLDLLLTNFEKLRRYNQNYVGQNLKLKKMMDKWLKYKYLVFLMKNSCSQIQYSYQI